jgi:isoquinoline 1-oxidoreductase alpha subunit
MREENFMIEITVNSELKKVDVEPDTPLLWVVREQLKLTGTKFGCGIAQCGACTVHVDGSPIRSCVTPIVAVAGKSITTIEGISSLNEGSGEAKLHALQQAWIDQQVPQCGYCQSGQIMSAVALLEKTPSPTDADIDTAMRGNVCRCGMYGRIRTAIKQAAALSLDNDTQTDSVPTPQQGSESLGVNNG